MAPSLRKSSSSVDGILDGDSKDEIRIEELKSRNMVEDKAWTYLTLKRIAFLPFCFASVISYFLDLPFYAFILVAVLLFVPAFSFFLGVNNFIYTLTERRNLVSKIDHYVKILDNDVKREHSGHFIPIRDLYELYAEGKIDFKGDVLDCLEHRDEYVTYRLQWWHLKFFLTKFVPEMLHFKKQDQEQVRDHYDRGNDFYESFLGPLMIYTSGIQYTGNESLEEMQENKMEAVCKKILLQKNDTHLDIGCGWGTLVNYAAEKYGTSSTGVTIARNQIEWATKKAKDMKLDIPSTFLCMDYRDIPKRKYDKITCLEMAEHVGVRLFPTFLSQVSDMLEEDGVFFLQIAGLRRAWQWEDFFWGFFMDTYIFPGADASLPLTFPVAQLEAAGFEVQSVETIGIHYSETIKRWYYNWVKSDTKEKMIQSYGKRLYRVWEIFLAWSTIIARQGNSTCYQIVAHKNRNGFDRRRFYLKEAEKA